MDVQQAMKEKGAAAHVVQSLDSIACKCLKVNLKQLKLSVFCFSFAFFACFSCFDFILGLLNLRGDEILYNPVFFAYVLLKMDEVLYVITHCQLLIEK